MDLVEKMAGELGSVCSTLEPNSLRTRLKVTPQSFEKDDDANGHIDFITAASVSLFLPP